MNEHKKDDIVQKIILKGKSVISGDIIFKAGNGEILADKDVIIKGKIDGGQDALDGRLIHSGEF
jgi:hypothetical protein